MIKYCQLCQHTLKKKDFGKCCQDCRKEKRREAYKRWRAKNVKKKVKIVTIKPLIIKRVLIMKRVCQECGVDIDTTRHVKYCRPCGIIVRERLSSEYRYRHKEELAKKAKVKYQKYKEWKARKLEGLEEKFYAK